MLTTLSFHKRFDFSQLPKHWKISRVTVDWSGQPLVLIEDTKPFPNEDASIDRIGWTSLPPGAHHLLYWDGLTEKTITFESSTSILSHHVQQLGDGWLLGEARGGRAHAYDRTGRLQRTLDLGDASQDIQTTPDGKIWVSYFDEGVYGNGIGSQQGLVCFDSSGHPMFKYFDFAAENQLPPIDDCYAMNVAGEDEIWISYYSAFPLVCLRGFQLHRVWRDFECMQAFAIFEDAVVFPKCYTRVGDSQLLRRTLSEPAETRALQAIDDEGVPIETNFRAAARGSRIYLWTEFSLYELASA